MQKALTEMNIQLANVISDIGGTTGLAILYDIVRGSGTPISWHKHSQFAPAARDCLAAWKERGGKSCYSLSNKVWIYTRSISKRFKHAMNELTGN